MLMWSVIRFKSAILEIRIVYAAQLTRLYCILPSLYHVAKNLKHS